MKRIATIITLCLFLAAPATAQYYLGVVKGEAKKIPLVVIDVRDDAGAPVLRNLVLDVLQADLRRSQVFDVLDPKKIDAVAVSSVVPTLHWSHLWFTTAITPCQH